ncbi:MAG: hypothetical protein K2J82_09115 [Muribaculaceae bacterium]|nr:hypothetical protein [Muribaculaceae bacterium]
MIELLSIKHVSNIIAIDFNYYEPESLVHNYWYPKFCAIYSSNLTPSGSEINLHQIYLRTGASEPTIIKFNEDTTSDAKVKDLYLEEGHEVVALSYLNEGNFRLLFQCFQRMHNSDYGSENELRQLNAINASKNIHSLIDELRGNGISLPSNIEEIADTIVTELKESTDFYR